MFLTINQHIFNIGNDRKLTRKTTIITKRQGQEIAGTKRKIAIVTGSSKGIGRAIALAFAKSKVYAGIVINGRKIDEVEEVAEEIRNEGCDSLAIEADISKEDDCVRLVEEADRAFGRIDVLVNNAGIQRDVPFEETTTEEWYKIIGVDLTGPFACSREVAKHMEKQYPKGGCIINTVVEILHLFIRQYRSPTTFLMLPRKQVSR